MRLKFIALIFLHLSLATDVFDRSLEQNIDAALFQDGPIPTEADLQAFRDDANLLSPDANLPSLSTRSPSSPGALPASQSDEAFVKRAVSQLSSPQVNIDKFIDDLDRIDCSKFNGDKMDPLNVLCDCQLVENAFEPLGSANTDTHDFFDYLQRSVYHPLAYNANRGSSVPNLIMDSMHLEPKNSLFHGQPVSTNYNKFEDSVLRLFESMADKTSDMESNKEEISDLIMNTLRRFHLYWNYLRFHNKFDKVKLDTKEVLRSLLKSITARRTFLDHASLTLLNKLTQGYFQFVKAHKILEISKAKGPAMLAAHIQKRYSAIAQLLLENKLNEIMFVRELAALLSLVQTFFVMSARKGLREAEVLASLDTLIALPVKAKYLSLRKGSLESPGLSSSSTKLKHFTAVFLLKAKHLAFIMFQQHNIREYTDMPNMNFLRSPFATKVYYEILDNMFLVPKACASASILKSCVLTETSKALKLVVIKHNIKRSTYGWFFLDHLTTMLKGLYAGANDQTWQSWPNFKTFYYSALFSAMFEFKKLFGIKDLGCISDLETALGAIVHAAKREYVLKPVIFGTLDIFDKESYNEFLAVKADYNNFAPIEKNFQILGYLKQRLVRFGENFLKQHEGDVTDEIRLTFAKLQNAVNQWYDKLINGLPTSEPDPLGLGDDDDLSQFGMTIPGGSDEATRLAEPENESLLPQNDENKTIAPAEPEITPEEVDDFVKGTESQQSPSDGQSYDSARIDSLESTDFTGGNDSQEASTPVGEATDATAEAAESQGEAGGQKTEAIDAQETVAGETSIVPEGEKSMLEAVQETSPANEETVVPPTTEEAPPTGETAPANEEAPPTEETAPANEESVAPETTEEVPPSTEEAPPVNEETPTETEVTPPIVEEVPPAVDEPAEPTEPIAEVEETPKKEEADGRKLRLSHFVRTLPPARVEVKSRTQVPEYVSRPSAYNSRPVIRF